MKRALTLVEVLGIINTVLLFGIFLVLLFTNSRCHCAATPAKAMLQPLQDRERPEGKSIKTTVEIDIAKAMVDQGGTLAGVTELYRMNTGQYPKELKDLVRQPVDATVAAKWRGPYIRNAEKLKDPWGRDLKYKCPGKHNQDSFDLWSVGPDGSDGTSDDIQNWSTGK